MNSEQRRELIDAIKSGTIQNATRYSEEFAARHRLNAETVRSAISRFRRELGLLTRRSPRTDLERGSDVVHSSGISKWEAGPPPRQPGVTAMTILKMTEGTEPTIARLGAAVLLRYELDDAFRRAVDEQRPEINAIHRRLVELREAADDLSPEERDELLR